MSQPLSESCEICGADDCETHMQASGAWICDACAKGTLADPNYCNRMTFVDKKRAKELVTLFLAQDATVATHLYAAIEIAARSANLLRWPQKKIFEWFRSAASRL